MELGAKHGDVLSIKVPTNRDSGLPRGFAFVDYKSQEEADNAIANLDGLSLNGRNIRASISDPNQKKQKKEKRPQEDVAKIYVGNLPFETSKEDLLEFYENVTNQDLFSTKPGSRFFPLRSTKPGSILF